ncbi:hypothetical protein [Eudoraea sp.]|uniref:hypothetical protein n=1 Tax=Eudoraea sp. TaxID=1979955 RepID=UPI003C70DE69
MINFEVSYDSDLEKAKEIIQEVIEANSLCIDRRTKTQKQNNMPRVEVGISKLGAYSITIDAFFWVANPRDAIIVNRSLNGEAIRRFKEEGLVVPYPNLVVRNEQDTK